MSIETNNNKAYLDTFAQQLQKETITFFMSVRPHGTSRSGAYVFVKLYIGTYY